VDGEEGHGDERGRWGMKQRNTERKQRAMLVCGHRSQAKGRICIMWELVLEKGTQELLYCIFPSDSPRQARKAIAGHSRLLLIYLFI